MAEFRTFDLGQTMALAENIKGMRRQAETDRLRDIYLGVQTQNAQQSGQIAADENSRAQETHAGQQRALEAKRVYHVASAIAASDDPLEAIQQLAPDLVSDYEKHRGPGTFAQMTPEQAKEMAAEMRQQSAIAAGIMPKYGSPQAGQQNGQDVFFQLDENDPTGTPRVLPGIQPRPQKKGPSTSLTLPDGTNLTIGEEGAPQYQRGLGLDKPNTGKLQEAFINAQGNAYALREQMSKFRPEYATFAGQFKAGVANLKDKAGWDNAPQQTQYLQEYTAWKSDTLALLSQYLNQLSGAAISPHEETRLKGGFPNADDGPTQYMAKAKATMDRFALVQARSAYILANPGQKLDSISIEGMSSIIAREANRLADSYEKAGMNEEAANKRAAIETKMRFGMGE